MKKSTVEAMGTIEGITSLIGVILYFVGFKNLIFIFAGFSLIHSILNVAFGDQNNLATEIVAILIGVAVAYWRGLNPIMTAALALCICSVLMFLIGIPLLFAMMFRGGR